MAEEEKSERTEEPTARRLQQAREKGDAAKSQEIPGWFILAVGLAVLALMAPGLSRGLAEPMALFLEKPHAISADAAGLRDALLAAGARIVILFAVVGGLFFLAGLAGHLVQSGFLFSASKLEPKLSKLNPAEGLKRMFGAQGFANFLKGLAKMGLVGAAMAIALWPRRETLTELAALSIPGFLAVTRASAIELLIAALLVYALIAAADFLHQRHEFIQRNKMSRRELRDETKETEGDPLLRARLRQIRTERARRRMMADVPQATVVITNPTHYAVALKYEAGETPAPVCLAKGTEALAERIREIAKAHDVPIVEDPPLARALHASVEIGEPIPPEHYKAVAKVIGYVLSVAKRRRS